MFDLEQAIAAWRQQLLAAGIQAPAPLEELESHLRDEIERQMKSGLDEADACRAAVQKIGQPDLLRTEFKKSGGRVDFLNQRRTLNPRCLLGLVWLVYYGGWFWPLGIPKLSSLLTLGAVVIDLLGIGLVGSVLLVFDSKWGRSIVRMNALIFLVMGLVIYGTGFGSFSSSMDAWVFFTFCLVSIVLLHWPRQGSPQLENDNEKYV